MVHSQPFAGGRPDGYSLYWAATTRVSNDAITSSPNLEVVGRVGHPSLLLTPFLPTGATHIKPLGDDQTQVELHFVLEQVGDERRLPADAEVVVDRIRPA